MVTARTQVREIIKESALGVDNVSADFMDRLDQDVKQLILVAVKRAKENGRRTVMARDL